MSKATHVLSATGCQILVDTNVWVDNYLPWRPHSQAVRAFLRLAREKDCMLLYAAHALKDIFFIINCELKRKARELEGDLSEDAAQAALETAWGCIENVRELATAVGMDESDAWLAFKYRAITSDLEDGLVLAAASRSKASFIVTSDLVLIRRATVAAHTPEDATALLEMGLTE